MPDINWSTDFESLTGEEWGRVSLDPRIQWMFADACAERVARARRYVLTTALRYQYFSNGSVQAEYYEPFHHPGSIGEFQPWGTVSPRRAFVGDYALAIFKPAVSTAGWGYMQVALDSIASSFVRRVDGLGNNLSSLAAMPYLATAKKWFNDAQTAYAAGTQFPVRVSSDGGKGFRRQVNAGTWADPGLRQVGDIFGPWILNDLRDALNQMVWTFAPQSQSLFAQFYRSTGSLVQTGFQFTVINRQPDAEVTVGWQQDAQFNFHYFMAPADPYSIFGNWPEPSTAMLGGGTNVRFTNTLPSWATLPVGVEPVIFQTPAVGQSRVRYFITSAGVTVVPGISAGVVYNAAFPAANPAYGVGTGGVVLRHDVPDGMRYVRDSTESTPTVVA